MGQIRGITYDSAQEPTRTLCPIVLTGVQHCAPVRQGDPDYVWVVYADVVHECGPYELGYDESPVRWGARDARKGPSRGGQPPPLESNGDCMRGSHVG